MPKDLQHAAKPPKAPTSTSFAPNHTRVGGRKPGTPKDARLASAMDVAVNLGFHPIEFAILVASQGVMPNADGTTTPCSPEMRLDAAKFVTQFMIPKLTSTQVTGPGGGPVQVTPSVSIDVLLADPATAKQAQELALKLAEAAQVRAIEGPRD